ncbi:aldehyde dehydrogenase family protein [Anaerobacillus isosaccharinicus]|uniref:Aldehyde dehydrogenase n=1 Tax=Anaerobacillus isosaccharinicus TaxID=1532552 RepID=A0A1S2M741_9BACI|nr:aldehyde dehydrogenase family protein [Anaerobacillus isosaccharinicus]MBA5585025.1 aldehyde dehydrogenase family protein [Anaerobacillus isosaccharinicus]QOY36624.1 aldehyde dehydrogenase family protein [Anaerobacillus isosaccharinicus]
MTSVTTDLNGITTLVEKAKAAQKIADKYSQEEVRRIAASIGWFAVNKAADWADYIYEETKLGDKQSKINRTQARARGIMRDIKDAKTVGVIEEDHEKHLVKIGKPIGVVASLVPMTVPEGVVFIGMMNAIMGRNAMICAPHPRAKKTTIKVVNEIRELFKRLGVPEDLLLCVEEPSLDKTNELMKQCDLVVATGGAGMVKAAYSSGTPAYGVGAGNVVVVIDETADFKSAANNIMEAQVNDLASGCSTENAAVIQEVIYGEVVEEMITAGAYLCNEEEKKKLQAVLWKDGYLNPEVIIKPATIIAEKAGFEIPADKTWLLVEESGIGPEFPFSGEKLSVVVTLYKYDTFDNAIELVNNIQAYSGAGHSCGIHSNDEDRILKYALETKTSRVAVRMPVGKSNAGNWNNGMPFTINLGCGSWGGNITSENITYKHYINTTWVAREIKDFKVPTDEELFGDVMIDKNVF